MEKVNNWNGSRIKTNITGLDCLLYGGLNSDKDSFILIKGASDTENTVFGMQILYGVSQSLSERDMTPESKKYLCNMEYYVDPETIEYSFGAAVFQYITFFGKIILTFMIIWIADKYRLMHFVLHKSLSLEQTPKRKKFFFQFKSSSK